MNLKLGSTGIEVAELQKLLSITSDGIFGPKTEAAVRALQTSAGLHVDGIAGPLTMAALGKPVSLATDTLIHGVDIYHGDIVSSFEEMKKGGISFIFIKASQGLNPDSKFKVNIKEARAAGLIVGAYHFMNFNEDGVDQAIKFYDSIGEVGPNDLPPVCDWEYQDGHNPSKADIKTVQMFLTKIEALTGRRPILYLSSYMPEAAGDWVSDYPLWIAEYGVKEPRGNFNWAFWQYSENAKIPGLGNLGDANVFNGNLSELRIFIEDSKIFLVS